MKIRCEQNSIRLRLRKSELVQLRAEQWLQTAVHLPGGGAFAWELVLSETAPDIGAECAENCLRVQVPVDTAHQWMDTDAVSIERFQPLGGGTALHILIEKDFPCKDRPGEDKTDFFVELSEEAPLKC